MPINTYKCSECGARNNYIVELGNHETQVVKCPRCSAETEIAYVDLPERLRDTISDLEENNAAFLSDMMESVDEIEDPQNDDVDRALNKVEKAFKAAQDELRAFDSKLNIDTDINAIAEQYAPREEENEAIRNAFSDNGTNSSKKKRSVKDVLKEKARVKARNWTTTRLAKQWNASEDEVGEIFDVVVALSEQVPKGSYREIANMARTDREGFVRTISQYADYDLCKQLVEMADSGNFEKLVETALADLNDA